MRGSTILLGLVFVTAALGVSLAAVHTGAAGATLAPAATAALSTRAAAAKSATAAKPAPASTTRKAPTPLLWKVSDADNSVYLLGSFHALKPDDYPIGARLEAAFADAEAVAFELSPEEMASPELALAMVQAASFGEGRSLRDAVDPATWTRLERYAQRRNQRIEEFERFEPWFVGLMISLGEMARIGYDPAQGLDQQLTARAQREGKRTLGLETGASQIAVLDQMGQDEQRQSLVEALEEADVFKARVDELHALWRRGDEKALEAMLIGEFKAKYPALYRRINVERNAAWTPKLQALLEQPGRDDTLVVVGAMHLLGPDGVVSLMRAKGYRVERL